MSLSGEKFLSEKAIKHLKGIDLTKQAHGVYNLEQNLRKDLPHYIEKFAGAVPYSSEGLSTAVRLVEMAYISGTTFLPPDEAKSYRVAFQSFVETNKDSLARDLACALSPLKSEDLKISRDDPMKGLIYVRKMTHKAWLGYEWEGRAFGNDFWEFAKKHLADLTCKKAGSMALRVRNDKVDDLFIKRNSGMYSTNGKRVPVEHNLWLSNQTRTLEILKIGVGRMQMGGKLRMPVFDYRMPKNSVFIVARDGDNKKHLMAFPDVSAASKQKELNVTKWTLEMLWSSGDRFNYLLKGLTYEGEMKIELFGFIPFLFPRCFD